MNSIVHRPYKIFWYSIPVLIGLSIIGLNKTVDIQLHDTYFVIDLFHIGILFSIFLGIIGFIYWLMNNKRLVHWMTAIHVGITISTFVLIVFTGLIFKRIIEGDFETFKTVNLIMFVLILTAVLSQLIFMANLVLSLLNDKKKD